MTNATADVGTYSELAAEYYDPSRHPTSANFREASRLVLKQWLSSACSDETWMCEVGAGRSLVAEELLHEGRVLARLLVVDSSCQMLSHSAMFNDHAIGGLLLANARRLPLTSHSLGALVTVLGDAYNDSSFWREVSRTLKPGGVAIATLPAYEWATALRPDPSLGYAEFRVGQRRVLVPSTVKAVPEQTAMIQHEGLVVQETLNIRIRDLTGTLSEQLLLKRGLDAPTVTGYLVVKPR
jgi:SAM-dependent methyltransferase